MSLTRREFLKVATATAGGLAASGLLGGQALDAWAAADSSDRRASRVVVARAQTLLNAEHRVERAAADQLLAGAMRALADQKDARESWRSLFRPEDRVGIKVNCIGKGALSSGVEIVESVAAGLRSIGVEHIIVWDRFDEELEAAGFRVRSSGGPYLCFGTNHPGVGFSDELVMQGEIGSMFSRIQTDLCTAIINVPVLKDHDLAGVSVAMKNNFGVIHNPNKYHFEPLHRALADLNAMDAIRRKTRLVVCDASRILYNGGPAFKPQWTDWFGGIVVSRDPVATDAVCWRLIESLRKSKGLPALAEAKRPPQYIELASRPPYSLGHCAEQQIDRVEVAL